MFFQYLTWNFEIMRESFSIAFFLIAIDLLLSKKSYFKYYLFCFFAFSFHISALILFFIPLFCLFNLTQKKLLFMIPLVITMFFITKYLRFDYHSMLSSTTEQLGEYSVRYSESREIVSFSLGFMVILVLKYCFLYKYLEIKISNNLMPILAILSIFCSIFGKNWDILYRISYYLDIPMTLCLFGGFFYLIREKNLCYNYVIFIILLFLIFYPRTKTYFAYSEKRGQKPIESYYPYKSVFNINFYSFNNQLKDVICINSQISLKKAS